MWNLMITISTISAITMATMMMSTMLSKKTITDQQKSSPFECGFNPQSKGRLPFSIQFFFISMLFLIFDIEITLIIPLIPIMTSSSLLIWWTSSAMFMMILLSGLYYEWNLGALKWAS
nr:NADH dehydrogenase subunit 3 [Tripetaloceroides tonkinensis]